MTTETNLLAAVLAAPADDLPRLAYADFLDDAGDAARAEFIRAQVALAAGGPDPTLQIREKLLLAAHAEKWLAPLRAKGGPLQSRATHGQFRRGFVEVVWMPGTIYLEKEAKLYPAAPVREVRITNALLADLKPIVQGLKPGRPAVLDISDRKYADAVVGLFCVYPFSTANLEGLRLCGCGLTDYHAGELAGIDAGWHPTELDVSFNDLTPRGLDALRGRFGAAVKFASTGA